MPLEIRRFQWDSGPADNEHRSSRQPAEAGVIGWLGYLKITTGWPRRSRRPYAQFAVKSPVITPDSARAVSL